MGLFVFAISTTTTSKDYRAIQRKKKKVFVYSRAYVAIVRAAFNTNNSSFVKALEPERLAVIEWAVNILFI